MDRAADITDRDASIAGTVCRAAAMARLGRAETAFVLVDLALARSAGLDPAVERWAQKELAEVARPTGRRERAEAELRNVLGAEPEGAFAATALADLLLDGGRAADAPEVLQGDFAHDGKLLRAALAEPTWTGHAAWLEERFAATRLRGDALHLREGSRSRLTLATLGVVALSSRPAETPSPPRWC